LNQLYQFYQYHSALQIIGLQSVFLGCLVIWFLEQPGFSYAVSVNKSAITVILKV